MVVFIDPPYNTGNDGFCYTDKFKYDKDELANKLGIDISEAERILNMESTKSNSHSAWLSFMYARLLIARELLTDDGVIFISIDERELCNLKLLCDYIFGEDNFVAICPRKTRGSATTKSDAEIQTLNDYILIYWKNKSESKFNLKNVGIKQYPYQDERGKYYIVLLQDNGPHGTRTARPKLYYPIYYNEKNNILSLEKMSNNDIEILPAKHKNDDGRWMWGKEKFIKDNKDLCVKNGKIYIKHYFTENEDQNKYQRERNWFDEFQNSKGTIALNGLFTDKGIFSNPKPVELIGMFIKWSTNEKDIILDFFSGSATTAHAMISLNSIDNKKRKFILVQLQEKNNDEILANNQYDTIDKIGIERIKRAAKKIKDETHADIDYGFKHYTLIDKKDTLDTLEKFDSNFAVLTQDEILREFPIESRLITFLCDDGFGLNAKYEEIDIVGYKGFLIDGFLYLIDIGFDSPQIANLIEKIDKKEITLRKIVIFGYAFDTRSLQQLKDNAEKLGINDNKDIIVKY